jgi:hypothetical protein
MLDICQARLRTSAQQPMESLPECQGPVLNGHWSAPIQVQIIPRKYNIIQGRGSAPTACSRRGAARFSIHGAGSTTQQPHWQPLRRALPVLTFGLAFFICLLLLILCSYSGQGSINDWNRGMWCIKNGALYFHVWYPYCPWNEKWALIKDVAILVARISCNWQGAAHNENALRGSISASERVLIFIDFRL